jgi:uncharacterized protein (TIGR03083 family)
MTTNHQTQLASEIPAISHSESVELATTAYALIARSFADVENDQWSLLTDCVGWSVRDLGGHLVAAMRAAASFRELSSQQLEVVRRTRREGLAQVDAVTAVQIDRARGLAADELVAELQALVHAAGAGRGRMPGFVRRIRIPVDLGYAKERWSVGYLNDVILTRDTWLHRIDLHRALGTQPSLTAAHDGRIIADIVADWAKRHGQTFTLELGGEAGGSFASSHTAPGELHELDAVEFCRIVSGRSAGEGLLNTLVPF